MVWVLKMEIGDKLSDLVSGRDYYEIKEISNNQVKLQRFHYNGEDFDEWSTFEVEKEKIEQKMEDQLTKMN